MEYQGKRGVSKQQNGPGCGVIRTHPQKVRGEVNYQAELCVFKNQAWVWTLMADLVQVRWGPVPLQPVSGRQTDLILLIACATSRQAHKVLLFKVTPFAAKGSALTLR